MSYRSGHSDRPTEEINIREIRKTTIVKPGGLIELRTADLTVGSKVEVIVLAEKVPQIKQDSSHPLANLSREQRIAKIEAALGGWKNDSEISEIFSNIDTERHTYRGRSLASFDE